MKRSVRLGLAVFLLLLALLAVAWNRIPDVDTDADIDAQQGRD